jgi:hypothetical protein
LSDKEILSRDYINIPDYSDNPKKQESTFKFTDMIGDILSLVPDVDISGFEFPYIDL